MAASNWQAIIGYAVTRYSDKAAGRTMTGAEFADVILRSGSHDPRTPIAATVVAQHLESITVRPDGFAVYNTHE